MPIGPIGIEAHVRQYSFSSRRGMPVPGVTSHVETAHQTSVDAESRVQALNNVLSQSKTLRELVEIVSLSGGVDLNREQ